MVVPTRSTTPLNDDDAATSSLEDAWNANADNKTAVSHILLKSYLAGLDIIAWVKSPPTTRKEMPVVIHQTEDGKLELKTCPARGRLLTTLNPDDVEPKVPNARLDNNLLVVLDGPRGGMFARRIYHEDNHLGPYALKLVRVLRIANHQDMLTEEFFSERLENLGIVMENVEEKKHKNVLMAHLRNPYKGK